MRDRPSPTRAFKGSSGQVLAREKDVSRGAAINELLTRRIAVLPANVGDPIQPFALGLWKEIRCLLKPELSVSTLRKATGCYVYSRGYQLAMAQPGSVRYDINGLPVETVSDNDRLSAQIIHARLRTGSTRKTP
ncbi:ProQ/FINO family protein [Ensifer sp. SL37]|uniref:ProQ/FINO family protein n=1 Tax=Ensifer sp. SL37 TaxID=2995137 RepID=UPI00227496DB|nr:ProQ/FINO family protein [Ensifer sp. SL37]MCY1740929.1 ProQ/FINO family protein [Ensifer sp. SL37]